MTQRSLTDSSLRVSMVRAANQIPPPPGQLLFAASSMMVVQKLFSSFSLPYNRLCCEYPLFHIYFHIRNMNRGQSKVYHWSSRDILFASDHLHPCTRFDLFSVLQPCFLHTGMTAFGDSDCDCRSCGTCTELGTFFRYKHTGKEIFQLKHKSAHFWILPSVHNSKFGKLPVPEHVEVQPRQDMKKRSLITWFYYHYCYYYYYCYCQVVQSCWCSFSFYRGRVTTSMAFMDYSRIHGSRGCLTDPSTLSVSGFLVYDNN